MKAWRKARPQSLHRKGVCAAWPPCCRGPAEPGGQASLHSGLPRGAPSLQAAWGWKKPKVAGKTCPDVPHRQGFSDRRTRQLSPSSRGVSSSCSLHRQPGTEEAGTESGPAREEAPSAPVPVAHAHGGVHRLAGGSRERFG